MADPNGNADISHPTLNLTPEEDRAFSRLFRLADTENIGVVTGEVAVKFFEKSGLQPRVLGEIWQIADTDNRGLLTPNGFGVALRLIGQVQNGQSPTAELALRPGPLPKFEGLTGTQPQGANVPVRVPPLTPDRVAEYSLLFERSGAQGDTLPGEQVKEIFERAELPNEVLGQIWSLADTKSRGALSVTEFIIAMHLLVSYKNNTLRAIPVVLPSGLAEAASRRNARSFPQQNVAPPSSRQPDIPPVPGIPKHFNSPGSGPRGQSPIGRPSYTPPQTASHTGQDNDWAIGREEKAHFDNIFNTVDKSKKGFITGEEAVPFFSNSKLPEDILAQIWDLADINSEGHLNRDEFVVAMHLIRQQRVSRGRPLPTTLPPNLVPPSMRQQTRPPAQPTAPAFDNAAYATQKSASEDLFGLDAFSSTPVPQQTHSSTGGSASFSRPFEADVFGNANKPLTPSSPITSGSQGSPQPSVFKPFVPSSMFGQTLTSGATGGSNNSGSSQTRGVQQKPSAMDDLLGDNDPEISSRLSHETSELANISNQIGQLSKQMGEVKSKRASTEHELSNVGSQKREFEMRLSQLRILYEQEVKDVKNLEERLVASRNETRKLQQEIASTERAYQDLQNQHHQVVLALEADQHENTGLKERIRNVNAEMNQLRPQLEKSRSDARQQKGLVAISKKQLATAEADRDKLRGEIESKPAQQDSPWGVPASHQVQSPGTASPVASNASRDTNPFFRKSPPVVPENTMSSSPFTTGAAPQSSQGTFDVFGPSYSPPHTTAPPTSFRSEPESRNIGEPTASAPSGPSIRSSEGPDFPTPASSPQTSSYHESPRTADPPAPPESRQITSSFLPFRENNQRADSYTSSMKVSAPPSRYGGNEFSGTETPTNWFSAATETPVLERDERTKGLDRTDTNKNETGFSTSSGLADRSTINPAEANGSRGPTAKANESRSSFQGFNAPGGTSSIPGAFPTDATSPIQPDQTGESTLSDRSKASSRPSDGFRPDPFAIGREQRAIPTKKDDFDDAFASFGSAKQSQERQHTGGSSADGSVGTGSVGVTRFNREFPPIREHGDDDDSDSNSERGFDDNFTSNSPAHTRQSSLAQSQAQQGSRPNTGANDGPADVYTPRPGMSQIGSNTSLPSIGAQKSPPGYEQTMGSGFGKPGSPRDSNQFPPEFSGLLPSRKDPTAPQSSPEKQFNSPLSGGQTLFGTSTASKGAPSTTATAFSSSPPLSNTPLSTAPSDAYQSAVSHPSQKGPSPPQPQHTVNYDNGDFDKEFADLAESKEADDKVDDDFGISSHHQEHLDEFNPTFDSPVGGSKSGSASQKTTSGSMAHAEDVFNEFEHNIGHPTQASSQPRSMQPASATSHDWDAMFVAIPPKENLGSVLGQNGSASVPSTLSNSRAVGENASSSSAPTKPPMPGRAISGTEHDDPSLMKLTGMGYPRDAALNALEKYGYKIDEASFDHSNYTDLQTTYLILFAGGRLPCS